MKTSYLFIAIFLISFMGIAQEIEKSSYFLIRHAEKDRSNEENKNPDLTEDGKKRAIKWSELISDYGIDAVYSTEYNRTMQTAQPTAEKIGLEIVKYHPFKIDFAKFLQDTQGKSVLIVGHSNTIPFFANKLIKYDKYQQMEDNDNASLYIVTIEGDDISHVVIKTKN
ncbi:MAG: histidine phosphatase family protein [Flavobacteriaceae bacterium]|nr:histidine phosphatase family protein [Flavobacteriaceae bacterium]